jgi:hypothetical protein
MAGYLRRVTQRALQGAANANPFDCGRITGNSKVMGPDGLFGDAGRKSASGKSVAARHECARIPSSSRLRRC